MSRWHKKEDWYRRYTERYLDNEDNNYNYYKPKNKYSTLIKVILLVILLYVIYINWNSINPYLQEMKDSFGKIYEKDVKYDIEGITEIIEKPEPISDKTKLVEQAIFRYTNAERKELGIKELIWDDRLGEIARAHSLDMIENDFFSHYNKKGEDPTARAIRFGYNVYKELGNGWYSEGIAENIGSMTSGDIMGIGYVSSHPDSIGKAQVRSWMASSGHRENLLNSEYSYLGVGVAYDGSNYMATQDFF